MEGGSLGEGCRQHVRVHRCETGGIKGPSDPLDEEGRCAECSFEGDLLVEGHAQEKSQRTLAEQSVGRVDAGQVKCHGLMVRGLRDAQCVDVGGCAADKADS